MRVDETTLEVVLELQGRSLTRVKSWSIDADYLVPSDAFSFVTYDEDLSNVMGLEMQPVTLRVGDAQQLIGRIEKSTIGNDGTAIRYEGRDYMSGLTGNCIDPSVIIKEGATVGDLIRTIAAPVGIANVVSDSDVPLRNARTGRGRAGASSSGKDFRALSLQDVKPEWGDGIYSFAERVVARHGATIQPYTSRDTVAITAPDYQQAPTYQLRRYRNGATGKNNIKSATATRDFTKFATYTLFNGSQIQPGKRAISTHATLGVGAAGAALAGAIPGGVAASYAMAVAYGSYQKTFGEFEFDRSTKRYSTADAAAGFAPSAAETIAGSCHIGRRLPSDGPADPLRLYRLLAYRDADAKTQEQLERAAVRKTADLFKDTLLYEAEVFGHIDPDSGAVWAVDTIVDVVDEVCGISEPMWIASRTLSYSKSGGATTSLTMWRPGAFIP